ncbi:type IV pilus assembly protein PilC [Desulfonispora thiosulfatigenes DSM 11270]|uniref:Type IV pilus assembly protein PilC n=1 Tax=Desulfonispora thiosulfatigenes DSM 11270 TaxID=656914 RepID=A0A1W1VNL6_DESTI|nr:type II secretion system F family protein [Desulfonispora thiosulfatigenes]SMB94959.1 type IV pilus assembly protein PilC [Desulfonispora thiosulfatigenes DSM 11270]
MPTFKYKAINKNGEKIQDNYTAKTKVEVLTMLRQNNYQPISIEEIIEGQHTLSLNFMNKVKTKDISIFCRQFYTMLNAGITVLNCLDTLKTQTENKKLRSVINQIYEDVQKGLTFSESIRKYNDTFPDLLINMVEAGEVSGTLDIIMERMAVHFEKENKINNKVKGAMMYPLILSIVSILVVVFLLIFIMPTFVGMFEGSGVELPLPTRILLSISETIQTYWYILVAFLIALVFLVKRYITTDKGHFFVDHLKFKIPVLKDLTQKVVTSRFTRTLSTLLTSGIPLIQALEIVAKIVGNVVAEKGILNAKEEVRKGVDLATPIKQIGIFPPMLDNMIHIGEESGALDDVLEKTANFYDDEVETSLQKMTTLLEPLMIILMALVIGAIVIAMVLPMFKMMETVNT